VADGELDAGVAGFDRIVPGLYGGRGGLATGDCADTATGATIRAAAIKERNMGAFLTKR
jgi:hypothetical protein